jgi:hypothetical protein
MITRPARGLLQITLAVGLVAALAACGGSDDSDGERLPRIDGAETLDEREPNEAELEGMGFDLGDPYGAVYSSDKPLDEVVAFYDGLDDEGWDIAASVPILDAHTIMASKGGHVAMATIMSGAAARTAPLGGLEEFNLDLDALDDDTTLIVVTEYDCEEDSVDDCLTLGM